MNYHLAADGISLTLTLVTGLTAVCAVLFSWNVENRPNEFFFWLLLVVGRLLRRFPERRFVSLLCLLRAGHRPEIFPDRDLGIDQQGIRRDEADALFFPRRRARFHRHSRRLRDRAASFDLHQLAQLPVPRRSCRSGPFRSCSSGSPSSAGIWPFHTWAPTGHVAAPTAGSMLLAGIVMKLGAYGALRVAMNLFPLGFQIWSKWIAVLAVIGIVYAAAVALAPERSQVRHRLLEREPHGLCPARAGDGQCPRSLRRGSANVLARRDRRAPLRPGRRMIYHRTHTRDLTSSPAWNSEPGDAIPRLCLCGRFGRVDGHSRVSADSRRKSPSCSVPGKLFRSRSGSPGLGWCWWRPLPCAP